MKNYLFILRQLPHGSSKVQDALDMILTTAAFDQQLSLLFLDDGVCQLKTHQQLAQLAGKDTAAMFQALSIYDVNAIYVEAESLQERGLTPTDLILPVSVLNRCEINPFIQQHTIIISD